MNYIQVQQITCEEGFGNTTMEKTYLLSIELRSVLFIMKPILTKVMLDIVKAP